jgi:hypothetical protein
MYIRDFPFQPRVYTRIYADPTPLSADLYFISPLRPPINVKLMNQ